jgi:uncharacterized protein YqhQ
LAAEFHYGGQALIEGVMMQGRRHIAVSLRAPDGEIVTFTQPVGAIYRGRLRRVPFVRGILVLWESLVLGVRTLFYSAEVASRRETERLNPAWLWLSLAFGVILALGLFLVLPLLVVWSLDPFISSSIVSNMVDGVVRLAIFIAYLWAIAFIPDVRRLFAYHGAEHKTVNAYEQGAALEVDQVRGYSTAHARCGTAFILIVFVLAIIVFAFLGRPPMWLRLLERIALFPVIAAFSYEMMRLSAGHVKNIAVRVLLSPCFLLQALTTRQPDDGQLEVAISALKGALDADAE